MFIISYINSMTLTLVNFLSTLKNASLSKKNIIILNYNKIFIPILKILYQEGFILTYKKNKDSLIIKFRNINNFENLNHLKIISTNSKSFCLNYLQISKIFKKDKLLVFSTSKGFLTSLDCKKNKIGGILFFIC